MNGGAQEVHAPIISSNLFPMLGIMPAMGRNFLPEEDKLGNGPVAILSGELWKTSFASDPSILGRSVALNQQTYTVVGVLPQDVGFPQGADIWLPLGNLTRDEFTNRFYHPLLTVGRLADRSKRVRSANREWKESRRGWKRHIHKRRPRHWCECRPTPLRWINMWAVCEVRCWFFGAAGRILFY